MFVPLLVFERGSEKGGGGGGRKKRNLYKNKAYTDFKMLF